MLNLRAMCNPIRTSPVTFHRALRYILQHRAIATSSKNQEIATATTTAPPAVKDICPPEQKLMGRKNWISYGFETKDYEADRRSTHSIFFASITICMVFGGYYMLYLPDYNLRDWAQREAYLELRRRELANLPLINPNLIEPSNMVLPTDEELGDTAVII